MSPLNGKVALITGGSRGIGRALVNRFKKENWAVATCATSEKGKKDNPADFFFVCDVSHSDQVKQGIQSVIKHFGKIDVLINNAGLAGTNPLSPNSSDEMWHQIINVNLNGTYYFCKYSAPHLPDNTGKIINIASVLALKGVPDQTAYCSAKHGVLGLTRALALSLAPRKITVNAICPGWVRTEMAESRMKEIGIKEEDLKTGVPLGRFIEPSEIADFAYQIASSLPMLTGQSLALDGGSLL